MKYTEELRKEGNHSLIKRLGFQGKDGESPCVLLDADFGDQIIDLLNKEGCTVGDAKSWMIEQDLRLVERYGHFYLTIKKEQD